VAAALGNYPEHASWSLSALNAALELEANDEVREALAESRERLTTDERPAAGD
jgi:hypothetical protein